MYVLGINEGHGATAALLCDGRVIGCVSEERLNRIHGFSGFPGRSIQHLLESAGITSKELDRIVLSSLQPLSFFTDETQPRAGGATFYGRLIRFLLGNGVYWTTARLGNSFPVFERMILGAREMMHEHLIHTRMFSLRRRALSNTLGVEESRIVAVSHQFAHALAGLFAYPELQEQEALILTADGMGNHSCGAVYTTDGREVRTIAKTPNFHSLAFVYGMVTKYLGMKFLQHEYKVMGLSPYADPEGVERTYRVLRNLITVGDDLRFHAANSTRVVYFFLEDRLRGHRFDWIAGAAQRLVEDLVMDLARKAVERTGLKKIVLGGGLFMNVKANMAIMDLAEVEKVFPCPSSSDESCAVGSSIYGWLYEDGRRLPGRAVEHFTSLYLGPEYQEYRIKESLLKQHSRIRFETATNIETAVASLLKDRKVVARFDGRMEYGPRALGNRSILADPSFEKAVEIINRQIKNRDFWMPFAGTILKEREKDYIRNDKSVPAPYMSLAFRTRSLARKDLHAAIHAYDKTMRPQVLEPGANPSYYRLIKEFERLTGIGGVLNTSFNLHGEPIVCTPDDALHTFLRSGLEYLAIGNYLVRKVG